MLKQDGERHTWPNREKHKCTDALVDRGAMFAVKNTSKPNTSNTVCMFTYIK